MRVIKKVKPLFTSLVTTCNKVDNVFIKGTNIIDSTKDTDTIDEIQEVVSVGDMVRGIQVGDLVKINPTRFAVKKHQPTSMKDGVIGDNPVLTYNFNIIEIDDKSYLYLQDRDIDYVVECEEIDDAPPVLIKPASGLIV